MQYEQRVRAFYDALESSPLSTSAIALWHALMSTALRSGRYDGLIVAASSLTSKTALSLRQLYNARNELKQAGLIHFPKKSGGATCAYDLICIQCTSSDANSYLKTDTPIEEAEEEACAQPAAPQSAVPDADFARVVACYTKNIRMPGSIEGYDLDKFSEAYGIDLVMSAIAEAARNGARSIQYVRRILEDWEQAGVRTVEQAEAVMRERRARRGGGEPTRPKPPPDRPFLS